MRVFFGGLVISMCMISCGTLINPRYIKLSKDKQDYLKPQEIGGDFFYNKSDSNRHVIYKTDTNDLIRLIKSSDKPYVLIAFYAYFCGPCRENMPVLKEFKSKYNDKLNVVFISSCDWADIQTERNYMEKLSITQTSLIIDIYTYGDQFQNWKRLNSFITQLKHEEPKNYGLPYYMLFSSDGKLLMEEQGKTNFDNFSGLIIR